MKPARILCTQSQVLLPEMWYDHRCSLLSGLQDKNEPPPSQTQQKRLSRFGCVLSTVAFKLNIPRHIWPLHLQLLSYSNLAMAPAKMAASSPHHHTPVYASLATSSAVHLPRPSTALKLQLSSWYMYSSVLHLHPPSLYHYSNSRLGNLYKLPHPYWQYRLLSAAAKVIPAHFICGVCGISTVLHSYHACTGTPPAAAANTYIMGH